MRTVLLVLMLLLAAAPVYATPVPGGDCGGGLPCGPLPWNLPNYPVLLSPTPFPDRNSAPALLTPTATATLPATATATRTPTPTVTNTLPFDPNQINQQVETLQAVMNGTDIPIQDLNGTPVSLDTASATLTANTGTFWGYVKGLTTNSLGKTGQLLAFSIVVFGIVAIVKMANIGLPLLMAVWGIIRKIVQVVLDFIPF